MPAAQEYWFDHEKLEVYREAIAFVGWVSALLEGTVRVGDVKDQLDRASTSIPLNIAEGNGKYAPKDRCRFNFGTLHSSRRSYDQRSIVASSGEKARQRRGKP